MLIKTHYDHLNIARDATSEAIRAAFKASIQKCNADTSPNADKIRRLNEINHSFAVLSNPVQRVAYDRSLIEQGSDAAGKASVESRDDQTNGSKRWMLYTSAGLALLIAIAWFALSDSKNEIAVQSSFSADEQEQTVETASTQSTPNVGNSQNTANKPMVVANSVPEHDQITIDKLIGAWNGASGGQKTLDISLKSGNSLVFRLDAKDGQSIGSIYGIAEFANSFANFYNQEYNCSILFTINSDVLHLDTSSCQEYHETGITFDGDYSKNSPAKSASKPNAVKTKSTVNIKPAKPVQVPTAEAAPAVTYVPRLLKYVATVKDADGNINKIELLAKNKESARIIIRDFRGNPKVVRIKEVKQ